MDKQELGKILEQFILRFEREPKNDPELSWFHKFDSKGKVTGVRDMEIVDYIVENVSFFVRGEIPYYYEHGVFIEDTKGVKLKYRIQKLIYRDQVNSSTIQRVYNLLITQPQIYRNSYELNKQPAHWINFRNAYYDVLSGELIEHDPKYMTINQIPFPYYPEDREKVLEGGANIRKYLDSSIPDSRCSGSISDTETTYISFGRGETDALIRQAETARRSTEIHRRNASSENRAVRDAETQSVTSAEQRRLE